MSTPVSTRLPARLTVSLACALALAGCASTHGLSTTGQPIDANTLSASKSLGDAAYSSAAFPDQQWWKALGDPQLDSLIGEALQGSPSLTAADARLRQAQAQVGAADAARKPTLDATGEYSGVQLPKGLVGSEIGGDVMWANVLMLNFKWAPDLWGGQRAAWESAVGQAKAAEVDAQAARLTLSANIARTYISLSDAFELLDVAQREQQRASHLRALSQQRVDAGLDNDLQLRQAESTIAGARQQAQAAQQRIDALRNALAALLGKGPDRGLSIARPQLLQAPAPAVPGVLPSELLGHRADVVAARWRVEAASRGVDARKAAFKPSVNLSAIVGLASSSLSDLFDSDAVLGLGGPAISLPIFDGGRLRANLDNADAQYDLAVASYNQSLVGAMHEVADAVQAARSLDAQTRSVTEARDAARKAYDLASSRYKAGLGTQLDVLNAQRPLLQLEQQLAGLQAQRYTAVVDLDQALGGGLPLTASSSTMTAETTP
ncbi:efflux transporter outer membrane subunit [Pseudoxanthomonas sp. JBR18]|uniref:efflux transporter outer membrane subunit n=1 Tax=Pseudoxanthomonas sp. JBR18 TaxID=2969308 RepID=UPI0023058761|nr:efflux transporter outer membrane subunit [Pseudoxanthomonas sp. JBR18]WCE03246.1 efflux transporter outer membrane subunit [Pseudoxanthomonas sp. JBR18]